MESSHEVYIHSSPTSTSSGFLSAPPPTSLDYSFFFHLLNFSLYSPDERVEEEKRECTGSDFLRLHARLFITGNYSFVWVSPNQVQLFFVKFYRFLLIIPFISFYFVARWWNGNEVIENMILWCSALSSFVPQLLMYKRCNWRYFIRSLKCEDINCVWENMNIKLC